MLTLEESERLCLVLVSTRNPLNIGAAARAMSNFGFSELRLVKPYEPSFQEARSAVGAAEVLKRARLYASVAAAVADCGLVVGTTAAANRELQHPLLPLQKGSRLIRKGLGRGRVALLFGSEKRGLSNDDLSHCHWLLRIPTREEHGSMNLGQAVAVCLYEMVRASRVRTPAAKPAPAAAGELERITGLLLQLLKVSEYVKPGTEAATVAKLRRMVRRLDVSATDAQVWLGMLRKIAHRS